MASIHKTLVEIQEEGSFERLEKFKDSSLWDTMTDSEKYLFARLLVLQGAKHLAQGSHQVLECFDIALRVSSHSAQILYQQGLIFASYTDNMRCLGWAHQAFTQATAADLSFIEAWYQDALVLLQMGHFEGESHYLLEANLRFQAAANLLGQASDTFPVSELYWKWGACLSYLGKCSGEPLDFHRSIEKFNLALKQGCTNPIFLNEYGNALADLGSLLEKPEYFGEALKFFNEAVEIDPDAFEGWYNKACCIVRLCETHIEAELLDQADVAFEKASLINPDFSMLWLKWGQLKCIIGKFKHDINILEQGFEKFEIANRLEPDHPQILCSLGEAELFVGAQQEKLELLQSASAKIQRSLELNPESPEGWYFYGSSLNELGRYFHDEKYYHQAIEKFQYGLSLTRQNPLLWYGLALAHFALGEMKEEAPLFEKTVRYFSKVIECGGGTFAQFWNDWGVALMKLAEITEQPQHLELAIEKFEKALKGSFTGTENEETDLECVYNYGCAFDLLGEFMEEPRYFEKAVHILSQVVQLDPDYVQARYNLALALSNLGECTFDVDHYQKSIEHFQMLLGQDSEDEIIQMDYGVTLVNYALLVQDDHHPERSQALFRQAETHLLQSASLGNSQAYYQLAGLYSLTDRFQYAMHFIERARFFGSLPPVEDLIHDDWLEGLRHTPSFRQFINDLSSIDER